MSSPKVAAPAADVLESWLPKGLAKPAATWTLFCFPFAGGSAQYYWPWKNFLPQWLELCPIQPPGRGERLREPAIDSIEVMAETAASAIALRAKPGRKIAIFGHSMGSFVSFEVCHKLKEKNISVDYLFISGNNAPHLRRRWKDIHDKSEKIVLKELKNYGGMSEGMLSDPELRALYLPTIRADFKILETYKCKRTTPLNIPVWACRGTDDNMVTPEGLNEWEKHFSNFFETEVMPGGHFYLTDHREVFVKNVIERLANSMLYA